MRQEVVWVLTLALGLRIGAALSVHTYLDSAGRDFLIAGDAEGYWELGRKLSRGEEYSVHDPPRRVMRMPAFPAFLAACITVAGERLWFVRLMLAVVGTAACGLVVWLGTLLVDYRTGVLAGGLAAVSPTLVGFSALVLTETMFAASLLISLILLAVLSQQWPLPDRARINGMGDLRGEPGFVIPSAAGVGVAMACFVRPSWLLVAPLFCAFHLMAAVVGSKRENSSFTIRKALTQSILIHAGLVIAFVPWTWRNWNVTGHFVPTTLWVGPSLYDGLNSDASGDSDMTFFERDRLMTRMSEFDMDHEYRNRAWTWASENPGRSIALGFIKFGRYWKPWPNATQFSNWWIRLSVLSAFLPMIGFAAYGLWLKRRNWQCVLLTVGPIVYFSAIHSIFVGSLRYRLPAEYPLLILTAVGMLVVWDRYRGSAPEPAEAEGAAC